MQSQKPDTTQNPLYALDDYDLKHLLTHLIISEQTELLHKVLRLQTSDKKNAWFDIKSERRFSNNDYRLDVQHAWTAAHAEKNAEDTYKSLSQEIHYSLIWSSINRLDWNLSSALVITLLDKEIWTIEEGLNWIDRIPQALEKATFIVKLVRRHIPDSLELKLKRFIDELPEIDSTTFRNLTIYPKVEALSYWSQSLPEQERIKIWTENINVLNKDSKWPAHLDPFCTVIPQLPIEIRYEILDKFWQIHHESRFTLQTKEYEIDFLQSIRPYLSTVLRQQALNVILDILTTSNNKEINSFNQTVENIVLEIVQEADNGNLQTASSKALLLQKKGLGFEAFNRIVDILPVNLLHEALEFIKNIEVPQEREEGLVCIIPRLALCGFVDEAVNTFSWVKSEENKQKLIIRIGANIENEMWSYSQEDSLYNIRKIKNRASRIRLLTELIPHLDSLHKREIISELVAETRELRGGNQSLESFVDVFPVLDKATQSEVLKILPDYLKAYRTKEEKILALIKFITVSSSEGKKKILEYVLQIIYTTSKYDERVATLEGLLPYLGDWALPDLLKYIERFQQPYYRVRMLTTIREHFGPSSQEYTLNQALSFLPRIEHIQKKISALQRLAPFLSDVTFKEMILSLNTIQDWALQINLFARLAQFSPSTLIPKLFTILNEIPGYEKQKARCINVISLAIPTNYLGQALKFAQSLSPPLQYEAISSLIGNLSNDEVTYLLKKALSLKRINHRRGAIHQLVPKLPTAVFLENINAIVTAIKLEKREDRRGILYKNKALEVVSIRLAQDSVINEAFAFINLISIEKTKILLKTLPSIIQSETLSNDLFEWGSSGKAIFDSVDRARFTTIFLVWYAKYISPDKAIMLAATLDDFCWPYAIAVLGIYLNEESLEFILEETQLTEIKFPLEINSAIQKRDIQPASYKLISEMFLSGTMSRDRTQYQKEVLAAIIPYLIDKINEEEALGLLHYLPESLQASTICAALPYLSEKYLEYCLHIVNTFQDNSWIKVVPFVAVEWGKRGQYHKGLDLVKKLPFHGEISQLTIPLLDKLNLVAFLPGSTNIIALPEALIDFPKLSALYLLLPLLPQDMKTSIFQESLFLIADLSNREKRASLFQLFTETSVLLLSKSEITQVCYSDFKGKNLFKHLATRSRLDFLSDLEGLSHLLFIIGGKELIESIFTSVEYSIECWP